MREMVASKMAACGNMANVRSIYRWKGKVEEADEVLVIIKTSEEKVDAVKEHIKSHHPYEVPEIMEFQPRYVNAKYLAWLKDCVSQ